ncbi:MAG TPA: M20/M25/M40 family metallo-hydrolase [Allosphingosinicella sp.]|nr:M20/M25/M40 family metallo-hydrolase [Allosphingosinicella sp.]
MRSVLLLLAPLLIAAAPAADRAASWWRHVETLAADDMEGREAGSEGHRRASDYVAARFGDYGLEPAGENGGWFQTVTLEERTMLADGTRASLVTESGAAPLAIPGDLFFRIGGGPPPERVDAPLLFVGYGLHLPEAGHDDLAGIDLTGKIAVVSTGDPSGLPDNLKSHARAERARLLAARGALGMILVGPLVPGEQPWANLSRIGESPGMYPAAAEARSLAAPFFTAYFNPAEAEKLFAGSPRRFADISADAVAGRPLAGFALRPRLAATIATRARTIVTRNVVGRLRGQGLAQEHVVLSAHLDGIGISRPVDGDSIYNGALDNAAGVAALLDIAEHFQRQRARPRRSVLFVALTAEEKGLLGSRWFARMPTVPRASIVANLNYDMALPLFPLTGVTVLGAEESSLGAEARAVGARMGLEVLPDPLPQRNSFIRSDQYSFIEAGIPAVAFKFGFRAGTPEAATEQAWRATRYHGPTDDAAQRVFREDEIRLHDFIAALALRVADAEARPRWNDDSFFRRFARD